MKAHFYSPMGLRGDHLVTLFNSLKVPWQTCRDIHRTRYHPATFPESARFYIHAIVAFSLFVILTVLPGASFSSPPLFFPDFTQPLTGEIWQGDLTSFRTEATGPSGTLRLDAPSDQGSASLATQNRFEPVQWEWSLRQDFAPSNSNRAFVFLNADNPGLDDHVTGLALRTGESGTPKHFRLLRFKSGDAADELIISDIAISNDLWYRIRLIRTPEEEFHLYIAEGRDATPLLQSGYVSPDDYQIASSGHFGFRTHFTATRSDRFFFGDVMLSGTLPQPAVTRIDVIKDSVVADEVSGIELDITFNVPPDTSVLTTGLFRLDDGTVPDDIHCSHIQECTLLFNNVIEPGRHALRIAPYRTIYNQQSGEEEHTFFIADEAGPGDLVINEFMYRPPGDMPAYVELYNHSDKLINLQNWRLQRRILASEPQRIITEFDHFIEPGGYVVLTSEGASLAGHMQAQHILEMDNFPRFNTASPDKIRLFSDNNTRIDSLHYQPSSWGGFEVALERKSSFVSGWLQLNWAESTAPDGGTPGYPNTVRPPDSPPLVTGFNYANADTLLIAFSRVPDPGSATTPGNVKLIQKETHETVPWEMASTIHEKIRLVPSEPLQHETEYQLQLSGVRDIFGNVVPDTVFSFHFFETVLAGSGDIVINEMLYRPDQQSNRRFIELLNRSNSVFDLRGWQIERSLGGPAQLSPMHNGTPLYLTPGEKAVISEPGLQASGPGHLHFILENFPALSRFGDSVVLRTPDGVAVDSLRYHPHWGGNRDGVSLERLDPDGSTLDPANWREHPNNHSAGIRNFHYENRPELPQARYAALQQNGLIRIVFNRFVRRESLTRISLNDNELILATAGVPEQNRVSGYSKKTDDYGTGMDNTPDEAASFLFQAEKPVRRSYKEVTIHEVQDVAGREGEIHTVPLAFPPGPDDMVINEIMYQPHAERYSSMPDQGEYVELYNRSGIALQLEGIHLHDRPDKNGEVRALIPIETAAKTLLPDGYAVIYADTSSIFNVSRIYQAFSVSDDSVPGFYRVDRLTLGLSTQGDDLYLAAASGTVVDSLAYRPSWHNPAIVDERGISLERILPNGESGDKTNWTSSTATNGGTPGTRNSVSALEQIFGESGITLTPNPFSPNGDGNRDHLIIHYNLDRPDYLVRVRIFDRSGRLVRILADGLRAEHSGKLIWDGRTERSVINRVGVYIIHFEAINGITGEKRVYREVAVLARPF